MSNNEDISVVQDVVNDLVQEVVQDDVIHDDVPDLIPDVPDLIPDNDVPNLIPDDDVSNLVPDDDTGIFTKKIDDDRETVIIDTGHGFTVETNKSQIENIIKENKLDMFDIRITLNNIIEDIEKIISDKVDESNFNDLCDLIALNFVYTYIKDGTKIPIL
jgi:hypothetical protein